MRKTAGRPAGRVAASGRRTREECWLKSIAVAADVHLMHLETFLYCPSSFPGCALTPALQLGERERAFGVSEAEWARDPGRAQKGSQSRRGPRQLGSLRQAAGNGGGGWSRGIQAKLSPRLWPGWPGSPLPRLPGSNNAWDPAPDRAAGGAWRAARLPSLGFLTCKPGPPRGAA